MIVMKFGGTSVADANAVRRVIGIVKSRVSERPVVVVSAFSGVTDALLRAGQLAIRGKLHAVLKSVDVLRRRSIEIAGGLLESTVRVELLREIERDLDTLERLLGGVAAVGELSPRTIDAVAAFGELISSKTVAAALAAAGVNSKFIDSRECMITDGQHTRAVPLFSETEARLLANVAPVAGRGIVPVLGGFIGATVDGVTTTIGRGGSDFSAAVFGGCLQANRVEIWTDVDGIMTTDPRVCPEASTVDEIGFEEAAQLAAFGAKVIHPATLVPAVQQGIPVWVLNTFNPTARGTCIQRDVRGRGSRVKAIAAKRGVSVFSVSAGRVLERQGFLQNVFDVLDQNRCPVELVCSSESTVSIAIAPGNAAEAIETQLATIGAVEHEAGKAILCLVGHDLFASPEVIATVFDALRDLEVRMVSQGASRTNLAVVVDDADAETAIRLLHSALFGKPGPEAAGSVSGSFNDAATAEPSAAAIVSGGNAAQAY
ncbi:MAG TPA: aspartate kinase [Terriglobales bacterium]|nr:aspartate kinase [Terriglobales bacterium]